MAIVKKYKVNVISITNLIEGVYTLELASESGKFKYLPGQFLHLAIDEYDPSAAWPESRCFSMQTSPECETIKITYSAKGSFTNRMRDVIKVGSLAWIKLPYGDLFTQEHSKQNTVFIAGGTGVTPFLSLFNDSTFTNYSNPRLYVGFRNRSFDIYHKELEKAFLINSSFQVTKFYQDEDGIIDTSKILNENDRNTSFFISGPPVMIKNFKSYFIANEIEAGQIKTDDWE